MEGEGWGGCLPTYFINRSSAYSLHWINSKTKETSSKCQQFKYTVTKYRLSPGWSTSIWTTKPYRKRTQIPKRSLQEHRKLIRKCIGSHFAKWNEYFISRLNMRFYSNIPCTTKSTHKHHKHMYSAYGTDASIQTTQTPYLQSISNRRLIHIVQPRKSQKYS